MSNKGMIVYKEKFITRIKNFFKNLFVKQNNNIQKKLNEEIQITNKNKDDEFLNEIKINPKEIDLISKKDNFLKQINGNEEALNMLSIERLKKLEKYYDNIIIENAEKIKKMQII